jgi:hypothetical protein
VLTLAAAAAATVAVASPPQELINLPTVVVPDSLIKNVSALLPALTSLPSILLAKLPGNLTMLPEVKLPEITVPGLRLTIGKILKDLPTSLNMTQGITDWLDAHTSLLGKAADGAAANASATGGVELSLTHPAVMDGGLAAAVEQLAGAKAAAAAEPVKVDVTAAAGSNASEEAPVAAADTAAAAAAAADVPAGPVVAGAPVQEVEVKSP